MLNVAQSFVITFVSIILSFVNFIRGPIALVVGVALTVFLLASPAEAAVIQCNIVDCSILTSHWYDLILERKAAVVLLLVGGGITIYLLATDKGESV